MKRRFLSLIAMVALCGATFAQTSALNVGYCQGEYNSTGSSAFSTSEADTWVSQAIYLPAETMGLYSGNSITQIHAALGSALNIDSLQVWLRSDLDGENLAQGVISKNTANKMAKGWNLVDLDEPYLVPADVDGMYVGLSFHQTKLSVGLSILSPDVVAPQEGALFLKLGSDAEWEDHHEDGTACIEAMIDGESLPQYNLTLTSLASQPTYVIKKHKLKLTASVRNQATVTISAFDAQCQIDGSDDVYTARIEQPIAYGEEKVISFEIDPACITTDNPAERTVTVTIANLVEGEDENPADNVMSATFAVVEEDFTRRVLIEEFTTEKCPNCPAMATKLHSFLEMDGYADKVTVLCHHSAYYTDWLTITADNSYLWLFNMGGSTFAPALMIDRLSSDYTSNQAEGSPIFFPSSAQEIANAVDRRIEDIALVSVNIEAEPADDDGGVNVKVSGKRVNESFTVNPARIVVALVEDSIAAHSQAGGTSDYRHMHVNRAYNSTWGEEIEWDGDQYSYECQFTLGATYVRDQLSIVAYIWDYDENSVSNCEVCNSDLLKYSDFRGISGITEIRSQEAVTPIAYYTIDGIQLSAPRSGLNIVRYSDGSTRKLLIK
ncbi:MAG: Omp28-related outer membrane protein [Bacteroidales bacterium]|nr:Omp28-related outer membrane protein [Bacteroidales bacterium]